MNKLQIKSLFLLFFSVTILSLSSCESVDESEGESASTEDEIGKPDTPGIGGTSDS